ncbi:MAG TPA: FAD:protein FMN transferase [Candidatus Saccharimonadales bacterium]|nr:FAD:protein FMN transferase [Candidatus Saccharimonadales bacterium]
MRRVEQIMGMPISIDIPQCQNEVVFEEVFDRLKEIDRKFSPYRPDSQLNLHNKGRLKPDKELKSIIKACKEAEELTDGFFSAWASGVFDPSGYVKGWAIDQAGKLIKKAGYQTFCVAAGGDILARSQTNKDWVIGIQNPFDKSKIIGSIKGKNFAVATSGNYERGEHIINLKTKKPALELASFTVTGKNIIEADVLATAGFVAGDFGINFVGNQHGYEALAINLDGRVSATGGMKKIFRPV